MCVAEEKSSEVDVRGTCFFVSTLPFLPIVKVVVYGTWGPPTLPCSMWAFFSALFWPTWRAHLQ